MRSVLRNSPVLTILAVAVVLRSLIAPGLIVENTSNNPVGLTVAYCEDFSKSPQVSISGLSQSDGHSHLHIGHVYDLQGLAGQNVDTTGHTHTGLEHESGHGLSSTHCGLWTASASFLADINPNFSGQQFVRGSGVFNSEYNTPHRKASYNQQQQPRAPPFLHTT